MECSFFLLDANRLVLLPSNLFSIAMAKRSHIYVVEDDNPHADVKSPFRFSSNKFAATRDIDHIQVRMVNHLPSLCFFTSLF